MAIRDIKYVMQDITKSLKKYALYLLGRRSYSGNEMQKKLLNKLNFQKRDNNLESRDKSGDSEMVSIVMDYLKDMNLVDDTAFAKALVDGLLRRKKSKRYIEGKLREKGIDKETVGSILVEDVDRERDSLKALIESKLSRSPDMLADPKTKSKLIRFLLYRGFSYSDVKRELEEMGEKY